MNKFVEGIPFILLVALVPFFFYQDPNIAQSVIVAAVAGLSGYRYYLDSIKLPDYKKLFENELREIKKENKDFRDKYGKMAIEKNSKKPLDNSFRW